MANESVIITNVVIWVVSTFVLVPVESYYAYMVYSYSNSIVIVKRKPGILLISVISAICFYFFFQTILLIVSIANRSVSDPLPVILYYVILPVWYISWFTFIGRLWLLYYTIRHNIALINSKWQDQIAKEKNTCDDYYLRYKCSLGTMKGIKKKLLIYALLTYVNDVVYGVLLELVEDDPVASWAVLLTLGLIKALSSTLIPMAFLIYMAYQINKITFADNIGLGRELRYCTYGYVLILAIRLADYTVFYFAAREQEKYERLVSFIVALEFFAWKIFGFCINLLQTRSPMKRFSAIIARYSTKQLGLLAHAVTLRNVDEQNVASANESLRMNDILHAEQAFNLFMAHCGSEHCTECVLSIIEMVQFKEKIYKQLSADGKSHKVSREIHEVFALPENCPKSDIVSDEEKNSKEIALALYHKYIAVGSDWEINVDYYARRKYQRLFGDEDRWMNNEQYDEDLKLYELFDKCLSEMANLVRSAFQRFKKSESFLILQNKKGNTLRGNSVPFDVEEIEAQRSNESESNRTGIIKK